MMVARLAASVVAVLLIVKFHHHSSEDHLGQLFLQKARSC